MPVRRVLLVLLLALGLASAVLPSTALAVTLPDVEDEVMCVECGTALNVSQAPSADREREFIRRRIAEGMTKQEILDALVEEYGPSVLGTPPDRGFEVTNWLVPAVLAVLAVGAVATTARRWRRAGASRRQQEDAGPDLDDEDARRLERDMAGYDL